MSQMHEMAGTSTVTLSPRTQAMLQLQRAHHRGIRAGWALGPPQMLAQPVGGPWE